MTRLGIVCCAIALSAPIFGSDSPTAAQTADALSNIVIDPARTYRVRDLEIDRGDITIYLTDGVLGFATPVDGRTVAAAFTTTLSDAGDAEAIVLPPQRSERASLASFTGSPNLDEHFTSALFVFSDATAREIESKLGDMSPVRPAPADVKAKFAPAAGPVLRSVCTQIDVALIEALLDNHPDAGGFFYAIIAGRRLGSVDLSYRPDDFEPVSIGQTTPDSQKFQLWSSFRPPHAPPFLAPAASMSDYHIETTIAPDLSLSATADFDVEVRSDDGRVLPFELSERLRVESASVDGQPAEVFQRPSALLAGLKNAGTFLVVTTAPLQPGTRHHVQVRYGGSVIRQTAGGYFVDDRTTWYPFRGPMMTGFDLTFHCPEGLRLVATGKPVGEQVSNGIRTVHCKTEAPEALAGFNLGKYSATSFDQGPYHVSLYSEESAAALLDPSLSKETAQVLDQYTREWSGLPIHWLSVSPIAGYFGQGFPGLIYLSNVSYLRPEDRPAFLRTARMDLFFSDLLLPHEIAHQWWGNVVRQADYRAGWLMEAMADDSALQFLREMKGSAAADVVLNEYRDELLKTVNGKPLESIGPVDFGQRLIDTAGLDAWHAITYEKGAWILQMLRSRLGDGGFHNLQLRMLRDYRTKPITNEEFRELASSFVPAGQPDRSLALFFDTWVYSTGIPKLALRRSGRSATLEVSGVADDFSVDVPLECASAGGKQQVHWIRAVSGGNPVTWRGGACQLPPPDQFLYQR